MCKPLALSEARVMRRPDDKRSRELPNLLVVFSRLRCAFSDEMLLLITILNFAFLRDGNQDRLSLAVLLLGPHSASRLGGTRVVFHAGRSAKEVPPACIEIARGL